MFLLNPVLQAAEPVSSDSHWTIVAFAIGTLILVAMLTAMIISTGREEKDPLKKYRGGEPDHAGDSGNRAAD